MASALDVIEVDSSDDDAVVLGRNFERAPLSRSAQVAPVSDEDENDWGGDVESESDDGDADVPERSGARRTLWDDKVVNPSGAKNWQWTPNLEAALRHICRCDIGPCMQLVSERLGPGAHAALFDHRRVVRAAQCAASLCMRDHLRKELERHLDLQTGAFSRSA
mmetsp:Transcript_2082/g.6853  ORF Transcript_2082/g.6853 Transcript_2082/m.6853 type:complete len:164 (+) Transcript_2082:153-644(+)|eukprot:scaffold8008_cov122-Isochrysis_galbana.AAC.3